MLRGGAHDHSSRAQLGDEIQSDRHLDCLFQQHVHGFLAHSLAREQELGQVAGTAEHETIHPREVLQGEVLGSAQNDSLVVLGDGVRNIEQRNPQGQQQAKAPCGRNTAN